MSPAILKITYGLVLLFLSLRLAVFYNSPELVEQNVNKDFSRSSNYLRSRLSSVYQNLLPSAEAGLVSGILFGEKNLIPSRASKDLRNVGLTHLIVASGSNLVFLSGIVMVLLKHINRRFRVLILGIVVIFYSFLTGFDPPIVRSAVMVLSINVSTLSGRPTNPYWLLIWTAILLICLSPELLVSLSFQLSFTATMGQVCFVRLSSKLPVTKKWYIEVFLTTIFAQMFTLPIVISNFGLYSLVSIFANVLVVWTVPWIMTISLVAGILTQVSLVIGRLVILPVHALCFYFWWIVGDLSTYTSLVINAKITNPIVWIPYCLSLLALCLLIEYPITARFKKLLLNCVNN